MAEDKKRDAKADEKKGGGVSSPVTRKFTVRGPENGFRRCGYRFGREPVEVELTEEQFEIIRAEPELSIIE